MMIRTSQILVAVLLIFQVCTACVTGRCVYVAVRTIYDRLQCYGYNLTRVFSPVMSFRDRDH